MLRSRISRHFEFTVYKLVPGKSSFKAVLNEGDIPPAGMLTLFRRDSGAP